MPGPSRRALLVLGLLGAALPAPAGFAQSRIEPAYSIWDVELGQPVSQVPEAAMGEIACGTNGGPPGLALRSFEEVSSCPPEPSGLREVEFSYDDEQDYIARALELEYKFLQGGTSVYAHPVVLSLLVDDAGLVQGLRILTDNRVSDEVRRTAYTLSRNFRARYGEWSLDCRDIPMAEGEQPVGREFVHEACSGLSPDGQTRVAFESTYLRKKGQEAINLETQQVNTGYFESQTRFEEVLAPYTPALAP